MRCNECGKTPLETFFNKNGHGGLRAKCKDHENVSRLRAKRIKLKTSKNIIATNGGSCPSRQKVVK